MKNKQIQKQLLTYADSLERKDGLLADAYAQMDLMSRQPEDLALRQNNGAPYAKRPAQSRRFTFAATAAVAVLLFVAILLLAPLLFNNVPSDDGYLLTSLSRAYASPADLAALSGVKYLNENESCTLAEAFLFKDKASGEVYVVALKYKAVRDGIVEEINIVSDLMGGLVEEYTVAEGKTLQVYDHYQNGEYYSLLCQRVDGRCYYVTTMSPQPGALPEYEQLLTGNIIP